MGRVRNCVAIIFYISIELISANDSGTDFECGTKVVSDRWPWHAALYFNGSFIGGGTLIDQQHVVTREKFVLIKHKDLLRIYLGLQTLDEFTDEVQEMNVTKIFSHGDIALVMMSKIAKYSDFVNAICLIVPEKREIEDTNITLVGWGEVETGKNSRHLNTTKMHITTFVQNDSQKLLSEIIPNIFCVCVLDGENVCESYRGGALYVVIANRYILFGITSFPWRISENLCDRKDCVQSIYVSVDWIMEAVKEAWISVQKCEEYSELSRCHNVRLPHTVAIIDGDQLHISSGTLISDKFVLTTALNIRDILLLDLKFDDLRVRFGYGQDMEVIRDFFYPGLDIEMYRHHIILLELKDRLMLTSSRIPVCLGNKKPENIYKELSLNGYKGHNLFNSTVDNYYQRRVKTITTKNCDSSALNYSLKPEEFCTSYKSEKSFTWSGIIGGPLQSFDDKKCMYTIVGITKMIIPPTKENSEYKIVFSSVTYYLDWIEKVVWGDDTFLESEGATVVEKDQS